MHKRTSVAMCPDVAGPYDLVSLCGLQAPPALTPGSVRTPAHSELLVLLKYDNSIWSAWSPLTRSTRRALPMHYCRHAGLQPWDKGLDFAQCKIRPRLAHCPLYSAVTMRHFAERQRGKLCYMHRGFGGNGKATKVEVSYVSQYIPSIALHMHQQCCAPCKSTTPPSYKLPYCTHNQLTSHCYNPP